MIEAIDAAVSAGLVGADGDFVDAEALVEGAGKFRAKLKSIVGKEVNWASPEQDVAVDEDVGGT